MAVAAINALNGNYMMRGCDQPLIVRFADPKKPRIGESRGHVAFGGPKFGPRSQEPLGWPAPNVGDPMWRPFLPNPLYPGSPNSTASSCQVMQSNSSASVQPIPAHSQPQVVSQTANQQPNVPSAVQQPLHTWQQSPSQELQQAHTLQKGSQSLKEAVSEMQKQLHLAPPPTQNLEQQQNSHVTTQQTGSNPQTVASIGTLPPAVLPSIVSSSPAVCASSETADLLECDWSEHICPDGFKYYYNCETCESRWEKPEEYILFLQQLPNHQQLQNPSGQQCQSPCHSQVLSTQQNFQTRIVPLQTELSHQKLQSPSSSSPAGSLSCASMSSNKSSHCPTVCPTGSCSSEGIRSCIPANV
ncbi:hypothetical protein PVL29_008756 [Vitis rotundifolia]|nr:hypothetical protein PVL29_008756 [Vitis rotundifolia]